VRAWLAPVVAAILCVAACSQDDAEFSAAATTRGRDVAGKVDAAKLKAHVAAIVDGRIKEPPVVSRYGLEVVHTHIHSAEYMIQELTALGYTPVAERTNENEMPLTTVYVDIPGRRPELVLLTGHHDAWYQAGADDNATALAVMLEAARILKDTMPARSIRIIAFDGEEEGSIGAKRYLALHARDQIAMVVNMDCVGYASHQSGSQDAPTGLSLRDTGDFLAAIVNEPTRGGVSRVLHLSNTLPAPVDVLGLIAPGNGITPATGNFLRSDHGPFWAAGIPAIFLTDTANFRNHNYHTADDTPEKLDYDFLARSAAFAIGAVAAFAESE
jgi:Zn-dependent M28 family amino/carboxypeptidase